MRPRSFRAAIRARRERDFDSANRLAAQRDAPADRGVLLITVGLRQSRSRQPQGNQRRKERTGLAHLWRLRETRDTEKTEHAEIQLRRFGDFSYFRVFRVFLSL